MNFTDRYDTGSRDSRILVSDAYDRISVHGFERRVIRLICRRKREQVEVFLRVQFKKYPKRRKVLIRNPAYKDDLLPIHIHVIRTNIHRPYDSKLCSIDASCRVFCLG